MSHQRRSVLAAVAVSTACVLPAFLVGALAVQIRQDLRFSESALGLAAATFFGMGALTSAVAGRLVERFGPRAGMRAAAGVAATSMAGIALAAESWPSVLGFLALGGAANAMAQPGSNLLLARSVSPRRRGTAFAVKQSAIPAAMLLGGLAVPTIALTAGWRWAFGGAAVLSLATLGLIPESERARATPGHDRPRPPALLPLAGLAVGAGLGAAAANTLGTFLVASSVDQGLGEAAAGLLFAFGSAVGLATRLGVGILADRRGLEEEFDRVARMLAVGGIGYALLATGNLVAVWPAVALAYAFGWGWPGLFNFSVVATHPNAPAVSTGITQTGVYLGAVIGPLAFGFAADHASYGTAWLASLAGSLVAAATVSAGARFLARSRRPRTALAVDTQPRPVPTPTRPSAPRS